MESKIFLLLCVLTTFVYARPKHCLCPDGDEKKDLEALWDYLNLKDDPTLPAELSPWIRCPKCETNDSNDVEEELSEEVEDRKKREDKYDDEAYVPEENEEDLSDKDQEVHETPVESTHIKKEEKRETYHNNNCPTGQEKFGYWCVNADALMS